MTHLKGKGTYSVLQNKYAKLTILAMLICAVLFGVASYISSRISGESKNEAVVAEEKPLREVRFALPVKRDTLTVQNWDSMTGARISWELEGNKPFSMTTAIPSTGKWKTYEVPANVKAYWHGGPLGPTERGHLVLWTADSGTVVIAREYRAKK
ncbi:MAG: hypothetical protein V1885_02985 [Candidatus Brennerbacteria bacterium]